MSEPGDRPTIWLSELQRRAEAAAIRLASQVMAINELGADAEAEIAERGGIDGDRLELSLDRYAEWDRLRGRLEAATVRTMLGAYEVRPDEGGRTSAGAHVEVEMQHGAAPAGTESAELRLRPARSELLLDEG